MTIRVVVIDDSPTMRAILLSRLAREPDIVVIGTAADAVAGRELIKRTDPDVVTLNIEMPGMNGLDFLSRIMIQRPTPFIVVSGATNTADDIVARALALGAVDCYARSNFLAGPSRDDQGDLAQLIRQAAGVTPRRRPPEPRTGIRAKPADGDPIRLIAIGASTGGVEALNVLLSDFPQDGPPVVVVQHVNARFAPAIARTLDAACPARVMLAQPGLPLRAGHVYVAPGGDRHMTVGGSRSGALHVRLRCGDPQSGHLPSVDALFRSVAQIVNQRAVGILLTGMGNDGAQGLLAIAQAGGHTIAQDEASCSVFGMPRAAIALGAAAVVAPINRIALHAFDRAA